MEKDIIKEFLKDEFFNNYNAFLSDENGTPITPVMTQEKFEQVVYDILLRLFKNNVGHIKERIKLSQNGL